MKMLCAQIPDQLLQQVTEAAAQQKVSIDQMVASALAAQLASGLIHESAQTRAARVNWPKVEAILARIPHAPPMEGDEK